MVSSVACCSVVDVVVKCFVVNCSVVNSLVVVVVESRSGV